MTKKLYSESTMLELGARGDGFELVGRTCVRGDHGGIWNEWIMRDDRGRVRWLAEARGELVVYDDRWSVDRVVPGASIELITVERGKATRVATWGDVPDAPKQYAYADCVSRDATFVTFDWSTAVPHVYCGAKRSLDELGLSPRHGFRWLSESDGDWVFVTPLDAWLARPEGKRPTSSGTARVDWAAGELPWQVEIGETTEVTEWSARGETLSREATSDEVAWSMATSLPPSAVAKAFGKRSLPKPKR